MDSIETTQEALSFLKSQRSEDTESTTEDVEQETAEVSQLDEQPEIEEIEQESQEVYVEIDGKEISLDEIRESLGSKFRQSDYTRKTQELAQERKQVEEAKKQATEAQKAFDSRMKELESMLLDQEKAVDWDQLLEEDPTEYLRQKQKFSKREKALEDARATRQRELDQERLKYLNAQVVKMKELLPDWVDDAGKFTDTMNKRIPEISNYLSNVGFSIDEVNRVDDARLWAVFEDAAKYRSIQTKKPVIDKTLKRAPKVLKPTKGRRTEYNDSDEAKKKFSKTGSEKDALAYLKSRRR